MNNESRDSRFGCGCGGQQQGCPPLEPIVMPCKVCNIVKCHPIEQPVICPNHTHVIHRYVPFNRYYYQSSASEETVCPGAQAQGATNIGGMGTMPNMPGMGGTTNINTTNFGM